MAEFIKLKCQCGHILKIGVEHRGKKGKCPKCSTVLKIPEAEPAATPPMEFEEEAPQAEAAAPPDAGGGPTCKNHPDREAAVVCAGCKNFLCDECGDTYEGTTLCDACLEDPDKADTVELRDAREELLRRKGIVVGDFSKEFRAATTKEAAQDALRRLNDDGRLLYIGIGLFFGLSCLSVSVIGLAAQKGWPILGFAWLIIMMGVHVFLFGGFVGTAKDVMFRIDFDAHRFLAYSLRSYKQMWPAVLLVPLSCFVAGPSIWLQWEGLLTALGSIGFLCFGFFMALPALTAVIEDKGLKASLKDCLYHLGMNWMTILGFNLAAAGFIFMWLFVSKLMANSGFPFVIVDALTGLVVALTYVAWIIASISLYFSLAVRPDEIASKAPPAELPVPQKKSTSTVIIVVLASAVVLAAIFYLAVGRKDTRRAFEKNISVGQLKALFTGPAETGSEEE